MLCIRKRKNANVKQNYVFDDIFIKIWRHINAGHLKNTFIKRWSALIAKLGCQ